MKTRVYKLMVVIDNQLVVIGQDISYHRAHNWAQKNENRWIGVRRVAK